MSENTITVVSDPVDILCEKLTVALCNVNLAKDLAGDKFTKILFEHAETALLAAGKIAWDMRKIAKDERQKSIKAKLIARMGQLDDIDQDASSVSRGALFWLELLNSRG